MDAEDWNRRYEGAGLLWTAQPNALLVAEVEDLPPGRALDLGCGEGRNAVWLAQHGWAVTGVDFSVVAVDKGHRLAEAQGVSVDWVVADVRTYQPATTMYDLVVALYLHLPGAVRRAVHAIAVGALRPGGTFLVVGHDVTNMADGYGGPQDPSILFTPEDLVEDMTGLRVVKAERVLRRVTTEAGVRTAIDTLARGTRTEHDR